MTHQAAVDISRSAIRATNSVRIGAEMEWLVHHGDDLSQAVDAAAVLTAALKGGPLPANGQLTVEPGGQIELSTEPHSGPVQLTTALERDVVEVRRRLARAGYVMAALGLDPIRPPVRSLHSPRYDAMEAFFEATTPIGRRMMCSTASLQINVDFGHHPERTWTRLTDAAPALAAMFANSPMVDGRPGSERLRIWRSTDPTRPSLVDPPTADTWVDYVLDSLVIDYPASTATISEPHTLRDRLNSGSKISDGEIRHHMSTLFPPIRPRGFLEIRILDALPRVQRAAAIIAVWLLATQDDVPQFGPHVGERWAQAIDYGPSADGLSDEIDELRTWIVRAGASYPAAIAGLESLDHRPHPGTDVEIVEQSIE